MHHSVALSSRQRSNGLGDSVNLDNINPAGSYMHRQTTDLGQSVTGTNFEGGGERVRHRQRPRGVRESINKANQDRPVNPNLEAVQGFNNLPLIHNHDDVVKTKDPQCALCLSQFRSIKKLFGATHRNCVKCGVSVCEDCSQHKLKLSLQDDTQYRTCNRCYCKMQNEALINFYHGLFHAKQSQIESLDTRKQLIKERIAHF